MATVAVMERLNHRPARATWRMRAIVALIAISALTISSGCHRHPVKRQIDRQQEVLRQTQRLYDDYLSGDLGHARRSVLGEIQLLEEADGIAPYFRAAHLFLEYSRLYVLERRGGN